VWSGQPEKPLKFQCSRLEQDDTDFQASVFTLIKYFFWSPGNVAQNQHRIPSPKTSQTQGAGRK
jgi:hypothetical protein